MARKATKTDCNGCYNNFYNGNNNIGVSECWCLKDARVKRRFAIASNVPTYRENFYEVEKPGCYRQPGMFYTDSLKNYPTKQ